MDEYLQSMYNSIMKVSISALEKGNARDAGHLFYAGKNSRGSTVPDRVHPGKISHTNATAGRAAHTERVQHMVTSMFVEFISINFTEKAYWCCMAGLRCRCGGTNVCFTLTTRRQQVMLSSTSRGCARRSRFWQQGRAWPRWAMSSGPAGTCSSGLPFLVLAGFNAFAWCMRPKAGCAQPKTTQRSAVPVHCMSLLPTKVHLYSALVWV